MSLASAHRRRKGTSYSRSASLSLSLSLSVFPRGPFVKTISGTAAAVAAAAGAAGAAAEGWKRLGNKSSQSDAQTSQGHAFWRKGIHTRRRPIKVIPIFCHFTCREANRSRDTSFLCRKRAVQISKHFAGISLIYKISLFPVM